MVVFGESDEASTTARMPRIITTTTSSTSLNPWDLASDRDVRSFRFWQKVSEFLARLAASSRSVGN